MARRVYAGRTERAFTPIDGQYSKLAALAHMTWDLPPFPSSQRQQSWVLPPPLRLVFLLLAPAVARRLLLCRLLLAHQSTLNAPWNGSNVSKFCPRVVH